MKRHLSLLLSSLLSWVLLCGCASRFEFVLAEADPHQTLTPASPIAVVSEEQIRPADKRLRETLVGEMEQQGFHLVSNADAKFVLSCWLEDNVKPTLTPLHMALTDNGHVYGTVISDDSFPDGPPLGLVKSDLLARGIRVRVYPARVTGSRLPAPAREGYIES